MKRVFGICFLSVVLLFTGCKSYDQKMEAVQSRLKTIEDKGLPDSVITPIRLAIVASQGEKKRNRGGEANKKLKEATLSVKKAEEFLEKSLSVKKPEIASKFNSIREKAGKELRGLHKKDADSLLNEIDSLLKIDFVFKAERALDKFEKNFPKMSRAQVVADSLKPKVRGRWVFTETAKNPEDKNVNAVEKKVFTFDGNGKSMFVEEKSGQSATNLKENWKFETWGNWDMKGDTVWVIATKFTQHEQTFWQFNESTKKWGHMNNDNKFVENKPNKIPAETLTIEKNKDDIVKQNRYVLYQDLLDEYKKQ